jgi:hypothetical protein
MLDTSSCSEYKTERYDIELLSNSSAILVSEIKSDAGHLSHDVAAMPQDEVSDKYQPVTPHMKGHISEQHVQTNIPVFGVYDDETDGCSFLDVFASIPEQQIYEEEQQESAHAPKCFSKPICSHGRPTGSLFNFRNEKKSDTELLVVCLNNASDDAVSEEATILQFHIGPVVHTHWSIKLTIEKGTHVALCVHEAIVHCHDERTEINIKKQQVQYHISL